MRGRIGASKHGIRCVLLQIQSSDQLYFTLHTIGEHGSKVLPSPRLPPRWSLSHWPHPKKGHSQFKHQSSIDVHDDNKNRWLSTPTSVDLFHLFVSYSCPCRKSISMLISFSISHLTWCYPSQIYFAHASIMFRQLPAVWPKILDHRLCIFMTDD